MRAVTEALATSGHLLSAGELHIAHRFLRLPAEAASLYARLHSRRGDGFRTDRLSYDELTDVDKACKELIDAGMAWPGEAVLSSPRLAGLMTVPELRRASRRLGRPTTGKRAELLARLGDPAARQHLLRPCLWIRHGGLFRRLARLFLGSRRGDLRRLLLSRMEILRYPSYQPTGGLGFFPSRKALLSWERGLSLDAVLFALTEVEQHRAREDNVAADLELVESLTPVPPWRSRFSARRLAVRRLLVVGRERERQQQPHQALELYRRLLDARCRQEAELVHRMAHALGAADQPAQGAALCQQWLDRVDAASAVALARTGRRLARSASVGWAPLPPLARPRARTLRLQLHEAAGARPLWATNRGPQTLESALVSMLADHGRQALHAEGQLWRTLFGLLFDDIIFAPVHGMLPTPLRTGPLDLGTPGFVTRRQTAVDARLDQLRQGSAGALLGNSWSKRQGEAIAGVSWQQFSLPLLMQVCEDLGGPAVATILGIIASSWRTAPRGLPDLVILAGPPLRLDEARPTRLPAHALLAEVKGPGDQLRDEQQVWLSRLVTAGVPAELWRVKALPALPQRG